MHTPVVDLVHRPVDFVLIANTFHGVPDKPRLRMRSGGNPATRWVIRHRKLASASARRNNRARQATWAEDRDADDAK
jgi:hypothetical protein